MATAESSNTYVLPVLSYPRVLIFLSATCPRLPVFVRITNSCPKLPVPVMSSCVRDVSKQSVWRGVSDGG